MPANLTPDYLAAEARFRAAQSDEDKLDALEEMYATIPKHKGTEKLRADIKRRISKFRERERLSTKKRGHADEFHVVKQGAGQIALIGPANSGKSSLLARLTSAQPEIAEYPWTTRLPIPGMMEYEDIGIQLVDTPPISPDLTERAMMAMVRTADAAAVVLDASGVELLDRFEEIRQELSKSRTVLVRDREQADLPEGTAALSALVVANKRDLPGSAENVEVLREFYGDEFPVIETSALAGNGLEELRQALFGILGIIRVYTKMPGKPPDLDKPFTLPRGSTLADLAASVHKDFVHRMRFARAWGKDMLDGAQIGRDHVLQDGYIVELHA